MYIYYIGFPLLLLAAIIDASVLVQIRYLNGQPALLLMLVISWALLNDLPESLPWAVMGGIFADLLSVSLLGPSSLALVIAVVIVSAIFGQISRRNLVIPPLSIALATMVYQSVWLVLVILTTGRSIPIPGAVVNWMLPSVVFNFLGILIVFRIMGTLAEFFRAPAAAL